MDRLDTEYDFVAIVDFLPETDRKQFQNWHKRGDKPCKFGVRMRCAGL